ncbi:linear amide C-N hydrolase [Marinomonas sp. S3726]|uniref:linear amide C-N hydrolase n=1 Tax=Marinomonas sp. S3726 TaxID=579484 RepID=UPI0005F9C9CA|nr:linear amide C-N hydrolase [Marinomonas sp. S3726]
MCTRVFNNSTNDFLTTARNMDWETPLTTRLFCFNKGLSKVGCNKVTSKTLRWESQYSSVVSMIGDGSEKIASEGINSEGLVANALFNTSASYLSSYASFDKQLEVTRWVQYVLDTCKYVSEAVDKFADDSEIKIQLINKKMPDSNQDALLHLAVSDIYGDSAVIEVKNGIFNVYQSDNFKVMTNQPDYETQILLNMTTRWQWSDENPTPSQAIPGGPFSADRFQRAAFYLNNLAEADSMQESIAQSRSIIANASVPLGFNLKTHDISTPETQWSSVSDHNNQAYYFYNNRTQDVCYCVLTDINFVDDVLQLDLIENNDGKVQQNVVAGLINHKFKLGSDPYQAPVEMLDNKFIA